VSSEDKDSGKKKPEAEDDDPLAEMQRVRGPALWAALVLAPLVLVMIFTLMRAPAPQDMQAERGQAVSQFPGEPAMPEPNPAAGLGRRPPGCVPGLWERMVFNEDMKRRLYSMNRPYRIWPPGVSHTPDHNPVRQNLEIDANGVITRSWCG
jgi:hypothetical protein